MSNKFLAEDLEEGLSKKDYTNAANNFEVEGQQEEYESLLYTKDFKSESNLNYETEGYGVGNYFVDDSNQNINEFFRFSLDLVEKGFEYVNGEIAGISDVANKMLWGKSIDPEKSKVLEKAYNENRYKMGGMEDTENTETIDLNAVDRMKGVSVSFKEWKNSQEEKLINNFIESSTRQQVYMQDKSKAQKIGLLGVSILNNAFLDPTNIFFGGFGSKALIRMPLAEYVYNMSDIYDRNIADYTLDDAKNIATMYAVGKTIGFTMNAPRMIKGAYDNYKQDIFDTARDFEAYKQSKGFEEYEKTQEENKSYKYHRNGKVFDNAEIPVKYYDEQTSPKAYLDNLKTEDREQVVADMKYLLPYNEDNLKNKNDYIFITSDDNLYSKIPKENIPDNKIEQTEEKINVNDLTQFKKQLRKISPDFIIKKSVSSNSIYVDLYNEGKVVLSGRISDHNKSFQSEGEISVILGEKEGIEYKKINSKDFSKKIKEYGYNEFLDKLSNFVKENNVKFSSNKTVDYITFSEVLDLSTKGKISKEIRDKALSNEIDIKSLPKKKMIKYLKELSNNNKTIEKKQVDILFNYIDKNPDLESFNPITNYANIFKKGDINKRIDLALNEGVIESDINLKDELQYRKENSIPLSPVTTHKGKEEILNYFDDVLYSKLKESGIQANDRILSFKDFKEVVNKFDLAFKGNNPTVKQLKFMLDNEEIDEFFYNERWNIENPLKKISDEEISMKTKNINEDNIESNIDYKAIPKNKEYLLDYMQGVFELANKELESTIGKNIPFVRNV
nr:hypothetical protein [Leptotrichiaceae bacterium]